MQTALDMFMYKVWLRKGPFFVVFFVSVLALYGFLVAIDFVPEPVVDENAAESANENADVTTTTSTAVAVTAVAAPADIAPLPMAALPIKIIFDELDREVTVLNPESREITDLDAALLQGAVRHPDSADFSEDGNMFILGHSSYLPTVHNRNYQAFNGIQKLEWGDTVRVQSGDTEYVYFVEKVYEAKASEVTVPMTPGEAKLTLATCNSFGSKDDRFIIEAKLVDQQPLGDVG